MGPKGRLNYVFVRTSVSWLPAKEAISERSDNNGKQPSRPIFITFPSDSPLRKFPIGIPIGNQNSYRNSYRN